MSFQNGLLVRGNINLRARPVVTNPDGSISTVRSVTFTDDRGRFVLLPTVVGQRVVSNDQAWQHYVKTGQHLGIFATENAADHYAVLLHQAQASRYENPLQQIAPALFAATRKP